ncbi:hypothetical protein [Spirosoma sp. KUDC1026]|uniref:hypothetical protein n=1 Tax=Spirosoma sp. KUDC1026 TaxID=2745947 RepID=UPI00159BAB1A|nr:hypothetical protein [Spirosoma sp. KUDC1026]QKZ13589.1 hypothetical protein HU175_13465 [Spirosoma sp. KUDC1026]
MPESDQSLGRKILSFFVKEEEPAPSATGTPVAPANAAPAAPRPVANPTSTQPTVSNVPPRETTVPGTIDPKFADHFADVLAKNNQPGPDYFEFRETLRSLSNLGLPEDKQYQAAWASFKALAGTSDVAILTSTANHYLNALNKDRDAFKKSVDAALSERVGGLQNEQKRLQTENEALAKQLIEIQKQIDSNTNRLKTIDGEISDQSEKINRNGQNYDITFGHFTSQIKGDIDRMTQYLK